MEMPDRLASPRQALKPGFLAAGSPTTPLSESLAFHLADPFERRDTLVRDGLELCAEFNAFRPVDLATTPRRSSPFETSRSDAMTGP